MTRAGLNAVPDAAQRTGERLATEKLTDLLVICSPAARTRETAEIVLRHSGVRANVRFDERIYEASLRDLLRLSRAFQTTNTR